MTTPEHKFTDRDVRENTYLEQLAVSYLQAYRGDFEFLLHAKAAMEMGSISTGIIRGVLNCMRTDPRWATILPAPLPPEPQLIRLPPAPRLQEVNLQRPARVRLKATFKIPYIMSTWPTANVVHMLDPRRTTLWWFPHVSKYEWWPYSYCGDIHNPRNHLGTSFFIPEDRRLCQRCRNSAQLI